MNQASNIVVVPEMQVLNDVALFDFIIGGSTGEKTVEADDFIREVGKMLPKGTFSWVSKYRSEAKREILKVGVARRVNNRVRGYFVPLGAAQLLSQKLKEIKANFTKEKAEFLTNLPQIIEDWANHKDNAGVAKGGTTRADLIRLHAPKREDLDRMLSFDTSAIRVQSTGFFGEEDALHSEVKGLVGQAALEIAEDVKKSWKGPAAGKTSSRVLGLIRRIRNKAEAMSVLSSKFTRLSEMCDKVLKAVPDGQNIEGLDFLIVSALLSRCAKAETILTDETLKFDPLDVQMPAQPSAMVTTQPEEKSQAPQLDFEVAVPVAPSSEPQTAAEPMCSDLVIIPSDPAPVPATKPQVEQEEQLDLVI